MTGNEASLPAPNETIAKFGYPRSLLADYESWVVLLRPQQVTLGAVVLASKDTATAFPALASAAYSELRTVTTAIERVLMRSFDFEKINYLMLMMVDPHVHFHVIPRYSTPREFGGVEFQDRGWPAVPDLSAATALDAAQFAALVTYLRDRWPKT